MRSAPIGFSWTTLFFGPFPMLFRGAWKWFVIQFLVNLCTFGFAGLVWMFIINRLYLNDLVKDGFQFKSTDRSTYDAVVAYYREPMPKLQDARALV